ncbi:hypothetical protein ACJO73_17100 [Citrobacter freundii]|uniref:hypothetical protein n=1 Tax=Citrobacter freundii TaxID=546 RepID=UPI0025A6B0AB|nr:hypothetical protein [Citrobacter freundii]
MSLKGLRFTLQVDEQEADTFAVANLRLIQNNSVLFDSALKVLPLWKSIFLEKTYWLSRDKTAIQKGIVAKSFLSLI